MNNLKSAVNHRPTRVDELFRKELYRVSHITLAFSWLYKWHVSLHQELNKRKTAMMSATYFVRDMSKSHSCRSVPILRKLSNVSVHNYFYGFAVVFYSYVIRSAEGFDRLDVVFDRYFKNSLKVKTRKGWDSSGTQVLQITDDVPFPHNFANFVLV